MKKIHSILILSLFYLQITMACDCGFRSLEELQKRELAGSECIFVGEVFEINDDLTFKIRVIESLDGGDLQGNVYIGQNWKYCYPYIEEKGTWLIYGGFEDEFLKVNACGLSRSFDRPIAPPSKTSRKIVKEKKEMTEEELYSQLWEEQRIDLANELNALRRKRDDLNLKPAGNNVYN